MTGFNSWRSYRFFAERIRRYKRFVREPEDEEFLSEVLRTAETRIRQVDAGFSMWRAQLGHGWRPEYHDGTLVAELPVAFSPERMKPLPNRAKEGRANPAGIPILYLATTSEAAISEVRPWIGSLVSCAHFKTSYPLKLVDLSVHANQTFKYYFEEPDAPQREEAVWTDIDQAFSEPVTMSDDTANYVPTQVIAELFKSDGYDGIVYKSNFGDQCFNIAIFDLESAHLDYCALHEVKSAKFTSEKIDNPYWIDSDGKAKTVYVSSIESSE